MSKSELLEPNSRQESIEFAHSLNSNAQIISISSITGENVSSVLEIADSQLAKRKNPIELDYDVYAQAGQL